MEVAGKRPRGRPKKRWCDVIQQDMEAAGVTVETAQDRDAWRRLTRMADPT